MMTTTISGNPAIDGRMASMVPAPACKGRHGHARGRAGTTPPAHQTNIFILILTTFFHVSRSFAGAHRCTSAA
ncbi:MAG: hypothetical protein Q6373_025025 [Candidatus Sigynarchaeota archaeon]